MLKKIEVNVSSLAMEEAGVNPLVALVCYQGGRITYSKGKNLAKGIRNISDEIDNVKRYNKYWKDVASGKYDIPYGMTKEEYSNYLKGLDKVQYGKALNDEILDIRENDKFTQWISATDIGYVSKSTLMKENILKNVEESRIAREASGYKSFIEFESGLAEGVSEASKNITDIITRNGLTVDKFNELRVKNTALLIDSEKLTMKAIRDSITMPDNMTTMQKVIPSNDISKYLDCSYTQVSGYVTKYDDVSNLTKYDDIYESLRLDYPGTAYKVDSDSSLGVIRFKTPDAEKFEIPYGVDFGGTITDAPPFTGNGFTKAMNDNVIPEYKCSGYLNVDDGAELYELTKDGKEILRAIYDIDLKRFISVN